MVTVSILLSIRNNIITLLNVLSIEKVNERSSSCYKTSQRSKLFWATHNRMVNDNDMKNLIWYLQKSIQVDSIFLRLSIEGLSVYSLTVQPFDYKFYQQICFKSQFVDLMEKHFLYGTTRLMVWRKYFAKM